MGSQNEFYKVLDHISDRTNETNPWRQELRQVRDHINEEKTYFNYVDSNQQSEPVDAVGIAIPDDETDGRGYVFARNEDPSSDLTYFSCIRLEGDSSNYCNYTGHDQNISIPDQHLPPADAKTDQKCDAYYWLLEPVSTSPADDVKEIMSEYQPERVLTATEPTTYSD